MVLFGSLYNQFCYLIIYSVTDKICLIQFTMDNMAEVVVVVVSITPSFWKGGRSMCA